MEEIGKVLVEAEGGCWHEWTLIKENVSESFERYQCYKCELIVSNTFLHENPDFSKWENFGRLLKIADSKAGYSEFNFRLGEIVIGKTMLHYTDSNQIPSLVAGELARIVKEKK